MKVEIELEDLEELRNEVQSLRDDIKEQQDKLYNLDENVLKKDAVRLSYKLFNDYMDAIFKHLGFGEWQRDSVIIREDLEHWLGKDWWDSDRITVELGANVTTKFKSAFLAIGILTKKEDDKKSDDAYDLV